MKTINTFFTIDGEENRLSVSEMIKVKGGNNPRKDPGVPFETKGTDITALIKKSNPHHNGYDH